MDTEKLKCSRQCILSLECEKQLPPIDHPKWWCRLLKIIDKEVSIPRYYRYGVLRDIFPDKVFNQIMSVLSKQESKCERVCECSRIFVSTVKSSLDRLASCKYSPRVDTTRSTIEDKLNRSRQLTEHEHEIGIHNPYRDFFRRTPKEAAIWWQVLDVNKMSLETKAQIATERIAVDFVDWLQQYKEEGNALLSFHPMKNKLMFSPRRKSTMAIPQSRMARIAKAPPKPTHDIKDQEILKMFDIGSNNEAANSLHIAVKEIACTTERISEALRLPAASAAVRFHNNLFRDIRDTHKKTKTIAFGKCLPPELKCKPAHLTYTFENVSHYLEKENTILEKLFNSIGHLTSARNYCEWLVKHPEITPPKNLLNYYKTYMDTDFHRVKHGESQATVHGIEWAGTTEELALHVH